MKDIEHGYGTTPEGAGHEHSDIDPSYGYTFGIWLAVAMVISAGIVYGTFLLFEGKMVARDAAEQRFPLAAGRPQEPPAPRLQTQPFKDVYLLRQSERQTLQTYGWVDQENGIVRVPIQDAMRLTIERGLPARAEAPGADFNRVVQDSSSGRTAGVR
ncbi:MAG: hypothetical protein Q8L86_08170 [Vicinamibacterales bacterium]|nr:hypothetical protein [Vicinamibacterales bacterium]